MKQPKINAQSLKESLAVRFQKEVRNSYADAAIADPRLLQALLELSLGNEGMVSKQAGWTLEKVADKAPQLLQPFIPRVVDSLESLPTEWQKRSAMRMLAHFADFPEESKGILLNLALDWLNNPSEALAVRVHAMQVAYNIALTEPEIKPELATILEAHFADGSAGFKSRARKILKQIRKN